MELLKSVVVPIASAIVGAVVATAGWGATIQYDAILKARKMAFDHRSLAVQALYPIQYGIHPVDKSYEAKVRNLANEFAARYSSISDCDARLSFSCAIHSFRIYSDARGWCENGSFQHGTPEDQLANAAWITKKFGNRSEDAAVSCSQLESGMANLSSDMRAALERVNQASIGDLYLCTVNPAGEDCGLASR